MRVSYSCIRNSEGLGNNHKKNPKSALGRCKNMLELYKIITPEKEKQDAYEMEEIQKYFTCFTK